MMIKIPCEDCNKIRLVETNGMLLETYFRKSPVCRHCGALRAKDNISKGWFKKGQKPWHAGTKGLINGSKKFVGIHLSPKTEFKYKNGSGYRHLFKKGLLKNECSCCGESNIKRLHVHHVDKNRLNNDILNLIVLCRPCHLKIHGRTEKQYVEGRKAIYV